MATGGSVIIPVVTAFNDKGVKDAIKELGALSSSVRGFGRSLVGALGFATATASVVNFVEGAITAARDYQQAMAGVNTVYGAYTAQVGRFIAASEQIGMSHAEAARNVTFLGSVFKKTGIPMEEVIGKTTTLVRLAADLASTYGHTVSEAMTGIAAMFRGEYDPIEKFGVAMKQNQVNALLAARGQSHLTGQMQIAAATLARYDLLLQNSTDAQGAFARQTNNLFEQQQILKAGFTDMQQALGTALIPTITNFISQLNPLLSQITPHLIGLFQSVGDTMLASTDSFIKFVDSLKSGIDSAKAIYDAFKPVIDILLQFTVSNFGNILVFVGYFKLFHGVIVPLITAVRTYRAAIAAVAVAHETAAAAATAQAAAEAATPWGLIALAVAGVATGITAIGAGIATSAGEVNKIADEQKWQNLDRFAYRAASSMLVYQRVIGDTKKVFEDFSKYASDETSRFLARTGQFAEDRKGKATTDLGGGAGGAGGTAVKTFFDSLKEDIAKQTARVKLQALGASTGLIDAILSSNSWQAAYSKIAAGGKTYISSLQKQFNSTKAGLDELTKAQEAATKAAEDMAKAQQDVANAILDFSKSMSGLLKSVSPLPTVTENLGAFEQAVVSTFTSINESLQSAVENKLLLQSSADNLAAYAKNTETTLRGIAKERDLIAQKIQDANALIDSTKNAVMGFVNLNDLLQTASQTVTEQTVSMIDGIRLTLTRTFDIQTVTGNLTDGFRKILDKTKKFAADLKSLKAMGLNKGLFQQIVSAGLDAGGQTAQAILDGGQSTVNELNGLFDDLASVGADVAETTARVMYGAGVDVTNGLIAGLLSQSDALAQAAQTLADAFATSFNDRMATSLNNDAYLLSGVQQTLPAPDLGSGMGGGGSLFGRFVAARASMPGNTYNIAVNSGVITDPAATGEAIVNAIVRYERTNGAVWVRSV